MSQTSIRINKKHLKGPNCQLVIVSYKKNVTEINKNMRATVLLILPILCWAHYYVSASPACGTNNVICYHGTWSYYRTGNGKYNFSSIPAKLCTHYIYAFAGLNGSTNKITLLDPFLDLQAGGLRAAANLKTINPDLKVLIGIGGYNQGTSNFSVMASSPAKRATFIASVLKFVRAYNFSGCDLDWEFPARRNSPNPTLDKANFVSLVKELSEAFQPHDLLVTAAVSAAPSTIDVSYDVPNLAKYLDFINVMTYDFHGSFDKFTGHNSPLYSSARFAHTKYADFSVNASINAWLDRGAYPAQVALGVPFYGRTNVLKNINKNKPGAQAKGIGGRPGPYTQTPGTLGYNEIVEAFKANNWIQAWDDEQKVPYAYFNSTWLSFDNEISIKLKVKLAKKLGLAGIMIWSIESDDFLGVSGTTNVLLKTIKTALGHITTTE